MKYKNEQKHSFLLGSMITLMVFCLSTSTLLAQLKFQGRIFWVSKTSYVGNWSKATAIKGVTVTLYGSDNKDNLGQKITSQKTNNSGYYELSFQTGYEIYNIVESQPSGYTSLDATSPDGSKINNNKIQFTTESKAIEDQDLTGNIFWEKPEGSSNKSPKAVNDTTTTSMNTAVNISVLSNDSDPDGDAISLQSVTSPGYGTATKSGNQVKYTPNSGFTGTDNFNYTISDGKGGTDQAKVVVTVQGGSTANCEIRGMKFNDTNNNHQKETWESGLSGWTIFIDSNSNGTLDAGETSTVTASDGSYTFTDLSPGTYRVVEVQQTDWIQTFPIQPNNYYTLTLESSQVAQDNDFGNYHRGTYKYDYGDAPSSYPDASHTPAPDSDPVWFGDNTDKPDTESGTQVHLQALGDDHDGNDDEDGLHASQFIKGGLGIIHVQVTCNKGNEIKIGGWIDFNQDGDWNDPEEAIIDYVPPILTSYNKYWIIFNRFVPSTALLGKTFARLRVYNDSSYPISPSGYGGLGEVCDYEVEIKAEGESPPEGNYVFGYKWNDMNGNGLWDSDESGLPNWTIWLDANQNRVEDAGDRYAQTDATGYFIFTGVADGTYKVGEQMQPGWTPTCTADSVIVDASKISIGIYFGNKQEESQLYDFGDAPSPYPTLLNDNGARHIIDGPCLGEIPDAEIDGQPIPVPIKGVALGDDVNGIDDEDCLFNFEIVPGETCELACYADTTGYLNVWLDLNIDGDWADADEHIIVDQLMSPALVPPPLNLFIKKIFIPLTADTGYTFLRFRISSIAGLSYDGEASDGEVEDWDTQIYLRDYGDAPSPYPTSRSDHGLSFYSSSHTSWLLLCLGNTVDGEYDALQNLHAEGDDGSNRDDEDGIRFLTSLIPGQTAQIEYTATSQEENVRKFLGGWIDFNQDGDWSDSGEKIIDKDLGRFYGIVIDTLEITVPSDADTGTTYARFTLSYYSTPEMQGAVNKPGEVEDYEVTIGDNTHDIDYGDAPSSYPVASHTIGGPWFGGKADAPDAESVYLSHPHALEDNLSGDRDDEDGLISTNFIIGERGRFKLNVVLQDNSEYSIAYGLDLNRDGDWSDPYEFVNLWITKSITSLLPPGQHCVPMGVLWTKIPSSTQPGPSYLRMRIIKGWDMSMRDFGHEGTGEVEDHEVMIKSSGDPEPPGGMIWGYKFDDSNGNGSWDSATEPALTNWTIWLDGDNDGIPDHFTNTDAKGEFCFSGLAEGTYTVGEVQQPGWTLTWPPNPGTHTITVTTFQDACIRLALLFGNQLTGEGGEGAVKWSQPPLYNPSNDDTSSYWGWRETSLLGDTLIADDWFCHDPRPVTWIRWWGAYADWDSLFPPPITPHQFHISIWTDVPREEPEEWSHPGRLIQEYWVNRSELNETWEEHYLFPDSMETPASCFKYTYYILPTDWFYQQGDSTVYWLSIAAVYEERPDSLVWGWLTREHYFHDDAVRVYEPVELELEKEFKEGVPLTNFWDMSFVLGTDDYKNTFDFGDAPEIGYGTTIQWNGAHHLMNPTIHLGQALDIDYDGQPHLGAQGDDDDGLDDENGILFSGDLVPGEISQLSVQSSRSGLLNAWIDFNADGDWRDVDEQIFSQRQLNGGEETLEFDVPENASEGLTYARFRFSTERISAFCGLMMNGEVEDYQITIGYATRVLDKPNTPIPDQFCLYPNYPNPFNPSTTIKFEIPVAVRVRIVVYNLRGQEIVQLVDRRMEAGRYSVQWNGRDKYGHTVSSGVYLCRLITEQFSDTGKLLLMK